MPDIWGSPDRYYASEKPQQVTLSKYELLLGQRLENLFPSLEERVERSFRQANLLIREHLRSETRLRLSNEEKAQNVPVRVVAGLPTVLRMALDVDPDVLEIHLQQGLLKKTIAGLEKVRQKHPFLKTWPNMKGKVASVEEISSVHDSVSELSKALSEIKFFEEVWRIDEDILGAYFFRQRRIELYWMAIGLIAADLGCTPEALTQVVAIHELAHAYTHIGFDLDDGVWRTEDFANSSTGVVEGLAQYFTKAVCERLEGKYPEILGAYTALLKQQSGPYTAHLDWIPENEAGGEIVRNAMVQFRTHRQRDYKVFIEMLAAQKHILGQRPKKNADQGSFLLR